MNFQGGHLPECIAQSQWTAARFWQSREKIQVLQSDAKQLQIQQLSQSVFQRLCLAFCQLFRIKTTKQFYVVTEEYKALTDLTTEQKEGIRAILSQMDNPFAEMKQRVIDTIQNIQLASFQGAHTDESVSSLDEKKVFGQAEDGKTHKIQTFVNAHFIPPASFEPQFNAAPPPIPSQPPLRLSFEETRQHLSNISESIRKLSSHVKTQSPWLLATAEQLHNYALSKSSLLRYVENKISDFFKSSLTVPDEDIQDFTALEEYRPLLTLEEDILYVEQHGELDEAGKQQIQAFKQQLEIPVKKLKSLQEYLTQCDFLDETLEKINEQIDHLGEGKLDFGLDQCRTLFRQLSAWTSLKTGDPQWTERMKRKVDYQKQQAALSLTDFLSALSEAVQVEFDESRTHLAQAENDQEFHKQLKCWETFAAAHEQLQTDMEAVALNDIPQNCQANWTNCLVQQQSLRHQIKGVSSDYPAKLGIAEEVNVEAVRKTRSSLTLGKQRAIKQQRSLEAESRYSPAAARALRLFLGYLQVWDMASPLAGALMNPIAKRDYQFYLSAMAKAKQENNTQNYAEAMERARSFWGVDQDFITMYDKYLQGDIQFNLFGFGLASHEQAPTTSPANATQQGAPSPPPSPTPDPAAESLSSKFIGYAKQLLPTDIGNWIAAFSGHQEGLVLKPDATEWERWAYYHIYPQYRDHAMEVLMDRFDRSPPPPPTEDSTPEQNLYFHVYKMYQSATTPELREEYQSHLAEAQKINRYETFTKEWDTFLRGQWEAFTTPIEHVQPSSLSLGKAMLRKIAEEATIMEQAIKETAAESRPDALKQEAQQLDKVAGRCHDLLQSKPLEYADKRIVKSWLKQVDACRQEFVAAKKEARGGIFYEQYRDYISLEQYQKFLNTAPISVSNAIVASVFGADYLSWLPNQNPDVLGISNTYIEAMKYRIQIMVESFLCTSEQTSAFCKEYLGNDALSRRVHHPEFLPFLEKLESKNRVATSLSRALAEDSMRSFKTQANQELGKLAVHDSLFFSDHQSGVIYELVKEPSRFFTSYTLRLYSADPRHDLQKRTWQDETEMLLPYREINGVYFNSFIDALQEMRPQDPQAVAPSVKDVYNHLVKKTHRQPNAEALSSSKLVEVAQNSYYQTLIALSSSFFPHQQQGHRSQFELQSKLLSDIEQQLTQTPLASPSHLDPQLLQQAAAAFSASLVAWHAEKVISDEELNVATTIAQRVRDETAALQAAASAAPGMAFQKDVANPPAKIDTKDIENLPFHRVEVPKKSEPLQEQPVVAALEKWDGKPESLVASAERLLEHAKACLNQKVYSSKYDAAKAEISGLVKSIPLNDTTFWNSISRQEAEKLLEILPKIQENYDSLVTPSEFHPSRTTELLTYTNSKYTAIHYVTSLKMLGVANQLINHFSLLEKPISFYSDILHKALINSPMYLNEPDWTLEINQLITFWENLGPDVLKFRDDSKFSEMTKKLGDGKLGKNYHKIRNIYNIKEHRPWEFAWIASHKEGLQKEILPRIKRVIDLGNIPNSIVRAHIDDDIFIYSYLTSERNLVIQTKPGKTRGIMGTGEIDPFTDSGFYIAAKQMELPLPLQQGGKIFNRLIMGRDVPYEDFFRSKQNNYLGSDDYTLRYLYESDSLKFQHQGSIVFKKPLASNAARFVLDETQNYLSAKVDRRVRHSPNDLLALTLDDSSNSASSQKRALSQRERELFSLSSQRETQIGDTLSYFENHIPLLHQTHYQHLLKFLLFEGDLLIREFSGKLPRDNQQFISDFSNLFNQAIGYYEEIKDFTTVSRLLTIADRFQVNIKKIQEKYPEYLTLQPPLSFIDSYDANKEFKRLLAEPSLSPEERSFISWGYYQSFLVRDIVSQDQAADLLAASIRNKLYPLSDKAKDESDVMPVTDVLAVKQDQLKAIIQGAKGNDVLNEIYRNFFPGKAIQWDTSKYPLCISSDGTIEINALKGTLKRQGESLAYLPQNIETHPDFIDIFGQQKAVLCTAHTLESDGSMLYMVSGPQDRPYRFIEDGPNLIVQKRVGDSWYQLGTSTEALKTIPHAVSYGTHYWFAADKKTSPSVIFTDKKTGAGVYALFNHEVRRLNAQGKITEETLVDISSHSDLASLIQGLDTPQWVALFKDSRTNQFSFLHLPRLGLDFSLEMVDGKQRAVCKQFEDTYLAKQQTIPELSRLRNYVVLENTKTGQRTLIVPHPQKASSDEFEPEKGKIEEVAYSVFQLDPHTQHIALPKGSTDRFHLVYLHMRQGDVKAAEALLLQDKEQATPYDDQGQALLQQIAQLTPLQSGTHPRMEALKLKALTLLIKNTRLSNRPLDSADLQQFAPVYLDRYAAYLKAQKKMGKVQGKALKQMLSMDDEKLLLRSLTFFLHPQNNLNHQRILSRMKELDLPISEDLQLMQNLAPEIDPVIQSPYLSFGEMTIANLPELDSTFQSRYEFLRIAKEQKTDKEQLRELAYQLIGEKPDFFSLFYSRNALISKIDATLDALQVNAAPSQKLSLLLLKAALHHPEALPPSLLPFVNPQIPLENRMRWGHEKLIIPLRSLAMTSEMLQSAMAPLPPKISPSPELKPAIYPERGFDFGEIKAVETSLSVPVNASSFLQEIEAPKREGLEKFQQALQRYQDHPLKHTLAQKELMSLATQAQEYSKATAATKTYTITDIKGLTEARESLVKESGQLEEKMAKLKASIEWTANHASLTPAQRAIQKARLLAEHDEPLLLDHIILSFFRKDVSLLLQHNPALTKEDFSLLFQQVQEYLLLSTRNHHIKSPKNKAALIKQIDQIETLMKKGYSQEVINSQAAELAKSLKAVRSYDVNQDPELLVFEHYVQYLLRPDQIQTLKDMMEGLTSNSRTGSGKTSAVAPNLGRSLANRNNIAISMISEALIDSTWEEFQTNLAIVDRVLTRMKFDRNSRFDLPVLERLLDRLTDIRDNQKVLLISPESMKSLFLKMMEKIRTYKQQKDDQVAEVGELPQEITLFLEIFDRFQETGSLTLDEVDHILDLLRSFHYTIGKPAAFDPLPSEVAHDIFLYMVNQPDLREYLVPPIGSVKTKAFTEKTYAQEIEPALRQAILKGEIGGEAFKAYMKGWWWPENKNKVERFLKGDITPDVKSYTDTFPQDIQDTLALLKEQLTTVLPLTMNVKLYEKYGPSTERVKGIKNLVSIPYNLGTSSDQKSGELPGKSGVPSPPGTIHGTRTEIDDYTILMYLKKKFSAEEMPIILQEIKDKMRDFIAKNPQEKIENSPQYKLFQELIGPEQRMNIFTMSEGQVTALMETINASPNKILKVVLGVILPKMEIYEEQLNTDSQLFGMLFKRFQGMSGTLWNAKTYFQALRDIAPSFATVETLAHAWNDGSIRIVPEVSGQQQLVRQTIEAASSTKDGGPCSLIDLGNIFGGIDHELIAQEQYKIAKDKKWETEGVAYYDKRNRLMVLSQKNGSWHYEELAESKIDHDKLLAYWDQSHGRGSHIPVSLTMQVALIVNSNTMLKDWLQAYARLFRTLNPTQKLHMVMTEKDRAVMAESIAKLTGKEAPETLRFEDLFIHILSLEATRLGEDSYRSFKQKIRAVVLNRVLSAMFKSRNPDEAADLYGIIRDLLESKDDKRPYEMYARSSLARPKKEVMEEEIAQFLASPLMQKLKDHTAVKFPIGEIEDAVRSLAKSEEGYLSDFIKTSPTYGAQTQLQTQTQTETQTETQQEQQISLQMEVEQQTQNEVIGQQDLIAPVTNPMPVFDWNPVEAAKSLFATNKEMFQQPGDFLKGIDAQLTSVFSPDLSASINLCPYGLGTMSKAKDLLTGRGILSPFDGYQKPFSKLLIAKDTRTGAMQVMMVDQNDVKQLQKMFQEQKKVFSNSRWQHMIYDLNTKSIYMQSTDRNWISTADLEKEAKFQRLKVQAKLFRGDLFYTDTEKKHLVEWLQSVDYPAVKALLTNKILPWTKVSEKAFNESPLGSVFKQLRGKKAQKTWSSLFG